MRAIDKYPLGIYEVTQGEYKGAALFLIDVSEPEDSEFVYLSIYNPESKDTHEIVLDEWIEMVNEDGLKRASDIPDEIKDEFLTGRFGFIDGL